MTQKITLKQTITLPLMVFYGMGTILGAGIYVLISKVVAISGMYAPVSFLLSAVIVSFSAFSYAELSSRFPRSAGEAVYVQQAFAKRALSTVVGFGTVATGLVSAAAIANGFVGYLHVFFSIPDSLVILLLVVGLALIACWGVAESVTLAVVITVIEIIGLFIIIFSAGDKFLTIGEHWEEMIPPFSLTVWLNITVGAFLAFYAYIGFEDMVNMAEEVKEPRRTLPLAIVIALVFSTLLYLLVAIAAIVSLPIEELAVSEAPFASIIEQNTELPVALITAISLIAIVNGALVQIIMGSRVIYGMADKGMIWPIFSYVHPVTRTPILATLLVAGIVLILALWLPLETLAKITSFIILLVFALVNLSLWVIKGREKEIATADKERHEVRYPRWVPLVGFLLCISFILVQSFY